ncbi:MAG: Rieske (2Fe-2S) protein, partial [Acidobacteria bacterium]|nr:Rieske (2Fe-2S) protein [Acidobacteriota bacterium]
MKRRTSAGQHTLPREYFVSPEIFHAERERIFARSWLLAGHQSQLAEPGSCLLFELERESVLVVRGFSEGSAGSAASPGASGSPGSPDSPGPAASPGSPGAGEIRAFHNHCRHRGSRLCQQGTTRLGPAIQCPYHAWTYGLDGALRAAPNMKDVAGFDRADHPLHRVALESWEG